MNAFKIFLLGSWLAQGAKLAIFSAIGFGLPVHAQQLVLAFEDVLGPSATLDGMARTQMLISGLRREGVKQALFFVRTHKINTKTRARLLAYDQAGHLLASQGHKDSLLKKINVYGYQVDLLKAHANLQGFTHYRGHFHHGYYAGGSDGEIRRKLEIFARENNLSPTYITTKSFDAYLNQRYIKQVNENRRVNMAVLEKVYVDMVMQGLKKYHLHLMPAAGVDAKQVLVLQENDLTAYFIAALVERIVAEGWKIVAPDQAFGYPKITREPVSLQTLEGYMKALSGIKIPIVETPISSHKNTQEIDAILQANQLFL